MLCRLRVRRSLGGIFHQGYVAYFFLSLFEVVYRDLTSVWAQTVVGINSWVAHANRDVYGEDADTFRPERWLEDEDVVRKRESYFMVVSCNVFDTTKGLWLTSCDGQFGQGSRTCIGKNISIMELSKAIPEIIRSFDFVPNTPSGEPEWKTENVWFVKTRDFYCKVRKRDD